MAEVLASPLLQGSFLENHLLKPNTQEMGRKLHQELVHPLVRSHLCLDNYRQSNIYFWYLKGTLGLILGRLD
jgi:hypothetical protein